MKLLLPLTLLTLALTGAAATCGSCWCAPGNGTCPTWQPQSYSAATIATLAAQRPSNPYALSCNPYDDTSCTTTPPQTLVASDTAVCGRRYRAANCTEYELVTYPSAAAAAAAGALVTHEHACGLCSTTQDLSVYMKIQDMTRVGKECAIEAAISEAWGVRCFEKLGFTQPCALIWTYDALFDAKHCAGICIKELLKPFNGPPPFCPINACLECDETKAGPNFKAFAGATRRRTGLLSTIVRPCASVAHLDHKACAAPAVE